MADIFYATYQDCPGIIITSGTCDDSELQTFANPDGNIYVTQTDQLYDPDQYWIDSDLSCKPKTTLLDSQWDHASVGINQVATITADFKGPTGWGCAGTGRPPATVNTTDTTLTFSCGRTSTWLITIDNAAFFHYEYTMVVA